MAQNITLLNIQYSDVGAVTLPKTGGGSASFTDVTDTTAAAEDVASGKYFYTAAGVKTAGTASGGGGAVQKETGSVTGSGTHTISITVAKNKSPDLIVIYRDDWPNISAVADRANGASIIRVGIFGASMYSAANGTSLSNAGAHKVSSPLSDTTSPSVNNAGFSDGKLYVKSGNNSNLWSTSLTYNYELYFLS